MKQNEKNEIAVEVKNVTARFNMASEKIDNLKEYFIKLVKRELMFEEFLALKNVSFSVKKGESWGIIGINGSGKSTLLKVICGILKPYKGKDSFLGMMIWILQCSGKTMISYVRLLPDISQNRIFFRMCTRIKSMYMDMLRFEIAIQLES